MRLRALYFILFLLAPAFAAQDLNLKISTDKTVYELGESVRVSGTLLDNSTPVPSAAIVASLFSESGSTLYSQNSTSTSSNGTFFTYLPAPSSAGNYKVAVNATSTAKTTGYIWLNVVRGANFKIDVSRTVYSPGDNVSVSVYAKDRLGAALSNMSINATLANSTGGLQNSLGIRYTDSEGKAVFSFSAPNSTGYYTFTVNGIVGQSIKVASFQVYAYVTNSKGNPSWSFSPDENVTINAIVTDSSGNPYTADISAVVTSPPPTVTAGVSNFTNTSAGKYQGTYVAGAQEGQYSVKVTATSGSSSAETYANFFVSNLYVVVERIEGAEGSVTPNASYYVLLTVRDASGVLKTNATVSAVFKNSMGEVLSSFSGTEDTSSRIYKIAVRAPSEVGTFDLTVSAVSEGRTATWSNRLQVSSVKAMLNTDKFTYSPGDSVAASVETQPATLISNFSYEVWGPAGLESSGSNFTQASVGTASFSFTAPRSAGFYSLNAKVNGIVSVQGGFEVKNYRIWVEARNGSGSDSLQQDVFPAGSPVYLHVNFQDPSGKYINITSSALNFSYSLAKLYSHTENREYSANISRDSVYESQSSTVAVLSLNASSLPSGDYGAELSIKDKSGAKDTAFGGFRIGGFSVRAFPQKWQYSQGEDVNITVSANYFNGTPIAGALVQFVSSEQAEKWPFVSDSLSSGSVLNGTTDASGRVNVILKSTWVFGFHNVRVRVSHGGASQEASSGFVVRGFFISGTIDAGTSLYPGQNYTLTATAQDSSGTPVSSVNVTLIEIRSAKDWNLVSSPNDNLGLTDSGGAKSKTRTVAADRSSGTYVLVLKGEKNGEVVYEDVWYEVKSFDVKFQSGKSGQYEDWFWAGMQQPGATIDIPTKVTKGGSAVSGANLSVVKLVRTDVWPNSEVSTTSNSTTTSSGGTGTVRYVLPSSLQSGEYALILNVSTQSSSTLTDPWRSPHILVRTYDVFMDLQKGGMFIWGTMASENVSVVFNVRYPQNFTGVRNVNVSLVAIRNSDETLFRNLSVQTGQSYSYPNNRTDLEGIATIPFTTPNRTGTFIIVGTAGGEEFRRWFDVTSFTPSIDMGKQYDFFLGNNVTFSAHAKDGAGLEVQGVTVNVSGVWNNWDWTPVSFTPQVFTTGSGGASVNFNLTQAGITSPGDYSARIVFSSGGSSSEFWMWFRVKGFDVRIFPARMFSYGDALNFTVQVTPSQAVSAKLAKLRSALNWNVIDDYSASSYNATTNPSSGLANVLGPNNLSRGEYVAEFNVSNSPPFFVWFDVRSFEVNAWLDRWAYQTGENLSLRVCPAGNWSVAYTRYGSSTSSGSFNISDSDNSCNTPKQLSGLTSPGGSYKLKLTLTGSNGQSEERWLWYEARTYDAWVWFERWQMNPGENATAHGNVRLGNQGVSGIAVALDSIGFEREYNVNATPYSELGITLDLKEIGWDSQSYAIVNLTSSGSSSLVRLNETEETAVFTNYSLQLFGAYTDKSGNPAARMRVGKLLRNSTGGAYANSTDSRGETSIQFQIPSDAKSGSHMAKFVVAGQEVTPWFEVIPFSYRAYLLQGGAPKKFLDGGKNASIIINSSAQLNVSIAGIMRNGWEPVPNITQSIENNNLRIGSSLYLNPVNVTLVNITCPPQQMFEPCRANITVNASGNVNSYEVWPWFMLNLQGGMVNMRNIMGESAEISIIQPITGTANATKLFNYTFTVPNQQGGYAVNLMIQAGETQMPDMLWFNIDNVNAWGWVERWQYNVGENVTMVAQVQRGPQPVSGYVANVTKLRYRQDFSPDSTTINTSYNATTGSDGMARIIIPGPALSGGEYEAEVEIYEPSNPGMKVRFNQWFRVKSFDVWMRDNGQWAVYPGENISFIVETNPPQQYANVTLFEYFFDFTTAASLELQQLEGPQHDGGMVMLGGTLPFSGFNITFFNTSQVCIKGPTMDYGVAISANLTISNGTSSRNVTIYGMDAQTGQSAPINISNGVGRFELRLNGVWCQPVNEQFHPLATKVAGPDGRATVMFNTSLLNDTVSSEHPLMVNVTAAGQNSRNYGGFMLKPFDVEAWFEGKSGNPSFLPSENITIKVRVSRQGTPVPNITILEDGYSICPEMSGPSSGGGGGMAPKEASPTGSGGGMGEFWCRYYAESTIPVQTDAFGMASVEFNGMVNGTRQSGNYDIGVKAVGPDGKYSFTKLAFTIAAFTATVSPSVAEPGTPVTVSIVSNMPNAASELLVEDKMSWNNVTNSFNFRSVAHGALDGSGSGTLVWNTTGAISGYYNLRISLSSGNTTKTSSASVEIRSYNLDVTFDKSSYLPGENMTITLRATKGGYPLPGIQIFRMDAFDEWNWATPSQFLDLSSVYTDGMGAATIQWTAPSTPSQWGLNIRTREGPGPETSAWSGFLVSRYALTVSSPSGLLLPAGAGAVFNVNLSNSTPIPPGTTLTLALVNRYNASNKALRSEGNLSAPFACVKSLPASKSVSFPPCALASPGLYEGVIVLNNTPISDFSNVPDALAILGAPDVMAWAYSPGVNVAYQSSVLGSTPRTGSNFSINYTMPPSKYVPFTVFSSEPFPGPFYGLLKGTVGAEPMHLNGSANLSVEAPDMSGLVYALTLFTDRDVTSLSEIFGGAGITGDLKLLSDIRQNNFTITQANASLKITAPMNKSVVPTGNFPITTVMGGNTSPVRGMWANFSGKGGSVFPFMGSEFWQNVTPGNYSLRIWLVNDSMSGTPLPYPEASDRVSFEVLG